MWSIKHPGSTVSTLQHRNTTIGCGLYLKSCSPKVVNGRRLIYNGWCPSYYRTQQTPCLFAIHDHTDIPPALSVHDKAWHSGTLHCNTIMYSVPISIIDFKSAHKNSNCPIKNHIFKPKIVSSNQKAYPQKPASNLQILNNSHQDSNPQIKTQIIATTPPLFVHAFDVGFLLINTPLIDQGGEWKTAGIEGILPVQTSLHETS